MAPVGQTVLSSAQPQLSGLLSTVVHLSTQAQVSAPVVVVGLLLVSAVLLLLCRRGEEDNESRMTRLMEERSEVSRKLEELQQAIKAKREVAEATKVDTEDVDVDGVVDASAATDILPQLGEQVPGMLSDALRASGDSYSKAQDAVLKIQEKSDEISDTVVNTAQQLWDFLEAFLRDTAKQLTENVQKALGAQSEEEEATWKEFSTTAASPLSLPLPLMVASLVAPLQLRLTRDWNAAISCVLAPLVLLLFVAVFVDWEKTCGSGGLWVWSIATSAQFALLVVLRWRIARAARSGLADLAEAAEKENGSSDGQATVSFGTFLEDLNSMHDISIKAILYSKEYMRALVTYDGIARSWMYSCVHCLNIIGFAWGGLGVYITVYYAVLDAQTCDAIFLRFVAHLYAFCIVLTSTLAIVGAVLAIVISFITTDTVAIKVLRATWAFDQQFTPSGIPIATIFARAILLRNAKDTKQVEYCLLEAEMEELRTKKQLLADQSKALQSDIVSKEERYQSVSGAIPDLSSSDALIQTYQGDFEGFVDRISIISLTLIAQCETVGPMLLQKLKEQGAQAEQVLGENADAFMHSVQARALVVGETAQRLAQAQMEELAALDSAALSRRAAELTGMEPHQLASLDAAKIGNLQQAVTGLNAEELEARVRAAASSAGAAASSMVATAQQRAQEAGIDIEGARRSAAELGSIQKAALEQLASDALRRAHEAGWDITDMVNSSTGTSP